MLTERLNQALGKLFPSRDRRTAIWAIALPIMGGMMSQNLLNLVDIGMVGRLGDTALAATGIGSFSNYLAIRCFQVEPEFATVSLLFLEALRNHGIFSYRLDAIVAARFANLSRGDVLWIPGANRT